MRCVWCLVVSVGLATAGCSSDSDNSSEPATTLGTSAATVIATDPTVSTSVSTTVDATTEATSDATVAETTTAPPPTSSAPDSTAATAAAITPEVLCVGSSRGNPVYFGYTNSSAIPIAVETNDHNVLGGALVDDVPLVPVVFAPGRVSAAFWAFAAETAEAVDLAWTVKGPDGVARTAGPDPTTPECTDDLLLPTADNRTPTLAFAYTALPEFTQPPQQIDFLATVVGVPAASVCASGLEPQAPMTWTDEGNDDGNAGSETDGPTARRTLPFEQVTDASTNETFLVASTTVSAFVVDVCGADGVVSKSWPIGASFERLRTGVLVCFRAEGGRITMEVKDRSVPTTCVGSPLPATGGARIRSLPR